MPQTRVGWRSGTASSAPISNLWSSIYAVYNADWAGSSSLKTSLYAVYNGESNANDSFGTNNGTEQGGLTYGTGKIGNAFQFNGSSYVGLSANSFKPTNTDFSISAWVNFSGTSANMQTIFSSISAIGSKSYGIIIYYQSNILYCQISNASVDDLTSYSTTALFNSWNLITFTRKAGSSSKLYINGTLVSSNSLTNNPTYPNNTVPSIGAADYNGTHANQYFCANGTKIDSVNIWNKELTQSEITELYNSGNGAQYIGDDFYKPTANDALLAKNGTAQGGLTYGVGKVGTAFVGNGTNAYVSLPTDSFNNLTGDFSISLWCNIVGSKIDGVTHYLFANTNAPTWFNNPGGFSIIAYNNTLEINIFDKTNTYGTLTYTDYGSVIQRGTWQMYTFTRSGNVLTIYVNGTQVAQATKTTQPIFYSGTTPSIFCFINNGTLRYAGTNGTKYDGFNIWQKALTQSEITELYNSGNGKQYASQLVPLLLDTYSAATVAHSMFKLKSSYTGYCLRVRRSSDNTSQDIGFVNNYIDVASMLSFVGSGDGYVSIWYDQVGSNNYVQNTAANQPQIVYTGMVYSVNGNVVIKGSTSRYLLLNSSVALTLASDPYNAAWWLSYSKDTQANQAILVTNNTNYIFTDNGTSQALGNGSYNITVTQYSANTLRLMNGVYNRTGTTKSATLYANNVNLGTNTNTTNIAAFGSTQYLPYNQFGTGNIYYNEFAVFQSSSTIDRSGINTSISTRILTGSPTSTAYDSLTNYYSGDSTTNDKKGSSNGTIVGSVTYASGKNNNDFSINGSNNNYVSLPTNFFKPSGSFTFNGWIKTANQTSTQTLITITDSNGYLGFRVFISNNAVVFRTFPSGITINELTTTTYTTLAQYSTSDYSMITAVNDINNGMRIYVNGLLIAANTTKQAISWDTTSINRIGANWDGGTAFNGLIGEIGLFNSALTNYQIDELYKNAAGKFY